MSASNSNLPAIILAVAVLAMLVAFYIADRSSGPSMAKSASDKKESNYHSSGPHSGYSGSLEDYLDNH